VGNLARRLAIDWIRRARIYDRTKVLAVQATSRVEVGRFPVTVGAGARPAVLAAAADDLMTGPGRKRGAVYRDAVRQQFQMVTVHDPP
jgi:hypothetical protein